jgi:hypothetical protein
MSRGRTLQKTEGPIGLGTPLAEPQKIFVRTSPAILPPSCLNRSTPQPSSRLAFSHCSEIGTVSTSSALPQAVSKAPPQAVPFNTFILHAVSLRLFANSNSHTLATQG